MHECSLQWFQLTITLTNQQMSLTDTFSVKSWGVGINLYLKAKLLTTSHKYQKSSSVVIQLQYILFTCQISYWWLFSCYISRPAKNYAIRCRCKTISTIYQPKRNKTQTEIFLWMFFFKEEAILKLQAIFCISICILLKDY